MDASYTIGSEVTCRDGVCGELSRVIVDPVTRTLTHLVVEPHGEPDAGRLVPVSLVDPDAPGEAIVVRCDREQFAGLEYAQTEEFIPAERDDLGYGVENTLWMPYFPLGGLMPAATMPGAAGIMAPAAAPGPRTVSRERVPLGEVQIRRGRPVHATDGDIGRVQGLVVDPRDEHVTHVLLEEGHLWGKKTVGIPIGAVVGVEDGIHLDLSKDEVRDLPEIDVAAPNGASRDTVDHAPNG